MQKPALVILAAGMGSRYGGLKQMAPVDEYGNLIIDYSIYDALQAGFGRVVCIIKRAIEKDFHEIIGRRIEERAELRYAFQELDMLPQGYSVPEGREKPWGTSHALLCCKGIVTARSPSSTRTITTAAAHTPPYSNISMRRTRAGNTPWSAIRWKTR
jgi:CTP:molybdopterin cytidylyltransferase MocA